MSWAAEPFISRPGLMGSSTTSFLLRPRFPGTFTGGVSPGFVAATVAPGVPGRAPSSSLFLGFRPRFSFFLGVSVRGPGEEREGEARAGVSSLTTGVGVEVVGGRGVGESMAREEVEEEADRLWREGLRMREAVSSSREQKRSSMGVGDWVRR